MAVEQEPNQEGSETSWYLSLFFRDLIVFIEQMNQFLIKAVKKVIWSGTASTEIRDRFRILSIEVNLIKTPSN